MPISIAGRSGTLVVLACSLPLLVGCQTGPRGPVTQSSVIPSAIYAQQRGWLVERYLPTGPNAVSYCVASRQAPSQELAFIATRSNTGIAMNKTGVPLMPGRTYQIEVVFDSGSIHQVQAKPGGIGMLVASIGGPDVGAVLSRFASADTLALAVPALGIRKLYDLEGSSWAIGKLSECIGVPPRAKPAPRPAQPGPSSTTGKVPSAAAKPSEGASPSPLSETPAPVNSVLPAPVPKSVPPSPSGGIDLDMELHQPVDLDEPQP